MGGGLYANSNYSSHEEMYKANFVFAINNDGTVSVIKNRYGNKGKIGMRELLIRLINESDDCSLTGTKLFDEPIKRELLNGIQEILTRNNIE